MTDLPEVRFTARPVMTHEQCRTAPPFNLGPRAHATAQTSQFAPERDLKVDHTVRVDGSNRRW